MFRIPARFVGTAAALALAAAPLSAQTWTNWTSNTAGCDGGTANWCGTLSGTSVTYTGGFNDAGGGTPLSELSNSGGTDFWGPNTTAYTEGGLVSPPDAGGNPGFIQFDQPFSGTINFGTAITNPLIAFISVGAPSTPVALTFSDPFTVLSDNTVADVGGLANCPHWGCGTYTTSGNTLTGAEFSGVIQFTGTFTSLTISGAPEEYWYGMTVGENLPSSTTPEPTTMMLLGTGLVGLMAAGRRRIRRS